jgi:hypothetical protein
LEVVEVNVRSAVCQAPDHHDSRRIGGSEERQQGRGERKVAEVVGAEVQLEPVRRGLTFEWHDDTGVVHQHFEPVVAGSHALAECGDRFEIGQVDEFTRHVCVLVFRANGLRCLVAEFEVTDPENDAQSATSEASPHFVSNTPGSRHHRRVHVVP